MNQGSYRLQVDREYGLRGHVLYRSAASSSGETRHRVSLKFLGSQSISWMVHWSELRYSLVRGLALVIVFTLQVKHGVEDTRERCDIWLAKHGRAV